MKIAVIGSGISGLLAARLLAGDHELELGQYLDRNRYSREFIEHYLIQSCTVAHPKHRQPVEALQP